MALVDPSQAASFDQSAVYKLDLSEVLAAILLDDTDFVSTIGISNEVATQTKHSWVEDALNATTALQSGGTAAQMALGTTTGTILRLSSSHITRSKITAGTLLKDALSGKTEVVQVTAVSSTSATVTRGYGATSAQTHLAAATWEIVANPRPQGMAGPADESTTRSLVHNFTQIFSKGVKITGTAQSIDHAGVSAEDDYQIDLRLRELKRELDRTAIMGVRAPNDVGASTYGTMGGIIDFVGFIGAGNNIGTAETLTPSVLNTMIKNSWDDGLYPDMVLVGGVQKQKISTFDQEFRRSTLDTRKAGYTVEEFVSDLGVNLRVVVDRWVPNDVCVVFDSSKVKILPLQKRAFFLEKLGKTGDSNDWQVVGEYTMEVRNASAASYHFNLKP
ncbi:MAG: DUF5309 family protein [Parcubacteria group bacterium]|nr:DUF5309 family protein [Parcubacteria group bacterium]